MQAILRHVSWIRRRLRQLRSTSRGYVERSASFAPPLVDISNAPPTSLRLSWICRTLRQLRSGSRGYVERSTSFAPQSVAKSTGRLRFTAASVGVFQHPASASPDERQELLQTLRILKPISRFEEFAPG